jgi:hypothetical protein
VQGPSLKSLPRMPVVEGRDAPFEKGASLPSTLPVAEQRDQDDERKRHAEQEKQYRPHDDSVVGEPSLGKARQMCWTWSRCRPPIVAAKLAQNAPVNSAMNTQSESFAAWRRATSIAACRSLNTSVTR